MNSLRFNSFRSCVFFHMPCSAIGKTLFNFKKLHKKGSSELFKLFLKFITKFFSNEKQMDCLDFIF